MVYQNDSDDSISEDDTDEEVCKLYGKLLSESIKVLINFMVLLAIPKNMMQPSIGRWIPDEW
jgi:hypothetical protein